MKNERKDFADEPKDLTELTEFWMEDNILPTENYLKENYWGKWQKWLRLDFGDQWDDYEALDAAFKSSENPATRITINMIGPVVRQLRAYATKRRSYISCKPTAPQYHIAAVLAEKGVNYEWRHNKFHPQVKNTFLEAAIVGFCWAESGWTTEVDMRAKPEPNEKFDFRDFIRKDSGYLRKLDCFKVGYDLCAPSRSPDTARWIYESFLQEPWYVVNNLSYNEDVRSDIRAKKEKPDAEVPQPDRGNTPYPSKKMYTLYRLWDKKFKRMYIFCKGVKRPLLAADWPWMYLDSFPIKMLPFIPAPYDYFPIGLPQWIEDLQFERNRIRTSMFHHIRTESGGQWYVTDALDKPERDKLVAGNRVIVGKDMADKPEALQTTPFPPEKFAIDGIIETDAQKIIGLPGWAQGATSPGRRAATEIMKSSQYTEMRIDDIVEELDTFIEAVASDQIKHMQANYTTERITDIAGPLGEYWGRVTGQAPGPDGKYWVAYDKSHIAGEFELEIESTVKPQTDPLSELQNMNVFMQACERVVMLAVQTQSDPHNIAGVNFIEILRSMADKLEIKDAARIIQELAIVPPPIMEQTALAAAGQQQPAAEMPVAEENQAAAGAVNPQSIAAGSILGALNGAPQQ